MKQSVSPMQLLISVVERGKGIGLIKHYKEYKLIHHMQAAGHGTAASHLLDTLGFGTTERDIILSVAPRDTMRQLMHHLKDDDRSALGARGIAVSLNLTGMTAGIRFGWRFLSFIALWKLWRRMWQPGISTTTCSPASKKAAGHNANGMTLYEI